METLKIENVNLKGNNKDGINDIVDFLENYNKKAIKLEKKGYDFNRNERYKNLKKVADYIVSGEEIDTNNITRALHYGSRDYNEFISKLK